MNKHGLADRVAVSNAAPRFLDPISMLMLRVSVAVGLSVQIPVIYFVWRLWFGEPIWTLIVFPTLLCGSAIVAIALSARYVSRDRRWRKLLLSHLAVIGFMGGAIGASYYLSASFGSGLSTLPVGFVTVIHVLIAFGALAAVNAAIYDVYFNMRSSELSDHGSVGRAWGGLVLCLAVGGALGIVASDRLGIRETLALGALTSLIGILGAFPFRQFLIKSPESTTSIRDENDAPSADRWTTAAVVWLGGLLGAAAHLWVRFLPLFTAGDRIESRNVVLPILLGIGLVFPLASWWFGKFPQRAFMVGIASWLTGIIIPFLILMPPELFHAVMGQDLGRRSVWFWCVVGVVPGAFLGTALSAIASSRNSNSAAMTAVVAASVGWALMGWIGVPILGTQACLAILAALCLALTVVAWLGWSAGRRGLRVGLSVIAAVLFAFVINQTGLLSGELIFPGQWIWTEGIRASETRIGLLTSIPRPDGRTIAINGRRLAAGIPQPSHSFSVHLAAICHGSARRVLLLQLTSGAASAIAHGAERVVVVQACPELVDEMQRLDPSAATSNQVTYVAADIRPYVFKSDEQFDVIVTAGDTPPNGADATTNTAEFFRLLRRRVGGQGVVCQEIPFWSYSQGEFCSLVQSFRRIFPQSSLWFSDRKLVLVGKVGELPNWSANSLQASLENQAVRSQLDFSFWGGEKQKLYRSAVFAGAFLCGSEELQKLAEDAPIHTDNLRFLRPGRAEEPFHAMDIFQRLQSHVTSLDAEIEDPGFAFTDEARRNQANNVRLIAAESLVALAERELQRGNSRLALSNLTQACQMVPDYAAANLARANFLTLAGQTNAAADAYRRVIEIDPNLLAARTGLGNALLQLGRVQDARTEFEAAVRLDAENPLGIARLAWILATAEDEKLRDGPRALQLMRKLVGSPAANYPEVLDTFGVVLANAGDFRQAITYAEAASEMATRQGNRALVAEIGRRIDAYREQRPFRQSFSTPDPQSHQPPEALPK